MPSKIKLLGKVSHIVESREAILVLTNQQIPKKGEKVVDQGMKWVGKTTNVFGPVKAPYIGVQLNQEFQEHPEVLIGKDLYIYQSSSPFSSSKKTRHKGKKTKTRKHPTSFSKKKRKSDS